MVQSDYLMREIEQLAQVLQQVIFKRGQKKYDEASAFVNEAYHSLIGLKAQFIHQLSDAQLISLLDNGTASGKETLITLAALLCEEANIYESADDGEVTPQSLRLKALSVYLEIFNNTQAQPVSINQKIIKELFSLVDFNMIPVHLLEKLLLFYQTSRERDTYKTIQKELTRRDSL